MSTTTTQSGHNNSVPVQITEEKGKLPGGVRKKLTITPFCPQNARNVNKWCGVMRSLCNSSTYLHAQIDTFDTWSIHKIPMIPYFHLTSNAEVRAMSGYLCISNMVTQHCLKFFGHIACSAPNERPSLCSCCCNSQAPLDWKQPLGRHYHTWLSHWSWYETIKHRSFWHVEEGNFLRAWRHSRGVCHEKRQKLIIHLQNLNSMYTSYSYA